MSKQNLFQIKKLCKFLKKHHIENDFLNAFYDNKQRVWRTSRGLPQDITEYVSKFCSTSKNLYDTFDHSSVFYNNFFLEAFNWIKTSNGHDFWDGIHCKWEKELYVKENMML